MEKSKVYFTTFKTTDHENLLQKLRRLMITAGMKEIDFTDKYTAIKIHFGEYGNLAFLRPNYAKVMADLVKESGLLRMALRRDAGRQRFSLQAVRLSNCRISMHSTSMSWQVSLLAFWIKRRKLEVPDFPAEMSFWDFRQTAYITMDMYWPENSCF